MSKILWGIVGLALAVVVTTSTVPNVAYAQTVKVSDPELFNAITKLGRKGADIREFYETRSYKPIWSGVGASKRKRALLAALKASSDHGLPIRKYRIENVAKALKASRSVQSEIIATQTFLMYAHDLSSGAVVPIKLDSEIDVKNPRRSSAALLTAFVKSNPAKFLVALAPSNSRYKKLLNEKRRLEKEIGQSGGVISIPTRMLRPGTSSKSVTLLRQRLTQLGYGKLGTSPSYDKELTQVVRSFQKRNGLGADGVAGPATLGAMNSSAPELLKKVIVNLERERWMNIERGKRHIIVNLAEFKARVIENDREIFQTVTVIGKRKEHRTPEFHDQMTHMVINPTWHVPRSIAGKEYLPILRRDPGFLARRGMRMLNSSGKSVNPANVDLANFTEKNFPYSIKQKPSKSNALGLVKFIFPNKYNIYLHDTPSKSLFNKQVRAFSHGCVRVQRPFELAYLLLEPQTRDAKATFHHFLDSGKEQYVNLATPVPVYLGYNTVIFEGNQVSYRPDIYGRDRTIFKELARQGVVLRGLEG